MKIKLPNVNQTKKRLSDGTIRFYYYHRPTGTRLPDDPASPEFSAALFALNSGEAPVPALPAVRSFSALIAAYKESPEFKRLSDSTKRDYLRYMDEIGRRWGGLLVSGLKRTHVRALRDKYADTPRTANYFVQIVRMLLGLAVELEWISINVASRPKMLQTGDGHRPWEEAEISAFRKHWKIGSRERVAFELLLNTGQRGGDVNAMVRQHVRDQAISVRQQKTGARVEIPISRDLSKILIPWIQGLPADSLHLLPRQRKRAGVVTGMSIHAFRHWMAGAIDAAGLPDDCTVHGLRYASATRLVELGVDLQTVADITGHATMQMARKYTDKRRRTKLAVSRLDMATAANGSANRTGGEQDDDR